MLWEPHGRADLRVFKTTVCLGNLFLRRLEMPDLSSLVNSAVTLCNCLLIQMQCFQPADRNYLLEKVESMKYILEFLCDND